LQQMRVYYIYINYKLHKYLRIDSTAFLFPNSFSCGIFIILTQVYYKYTLILYCYTIIAAVWAHNETYAIAVK